MGIADIVLLVVILIAVIVGLKKGLAGIFFGFFGFLIIGVALGFVVNLTAPLLVFSDRANNVHSSIGEMVYEPVYGLFPSDGAIGDLFHSPIVIDGDTLRLETTIVIGESSIENPSLDEVLSSFASFIPAQVMGIVTGTIKLFAREGQTLAMTLANMLTIYAVGTVMWIILAFVLTIIKRIIRHYVYKWLDNHRTASRIDRAVGAAITTIIIVCIVWGAGLFLKIQEDSGTEWAASANSYIKENTMLVNGLNEANVLIMIMDGGSANSNDQPPASE